MPVTFNRANSIEKYDNKREFVVGSNSDDPRYDIMTAVIINISEKHFTFINQLSDFSYSLRKIHHIMLSWFLFHKLVLL